MWNFISVIVACIWSTKTFSSPYNNPQDMAIRTDLLLNDTILYDLHDFD